MGEIVKLTALNDEQLDQTVDIIIEGFYNILKSISKDKEKIHRLFKNAFVDDMTYAYLQDGEAIGFLGLGNYQKRSVKLDKDLFIAELGALAGKSAYKAVSASMEKINVSSPDEVYVDFIATAAECRSMGIGKKLIDFISETMDYKYIRLDVLSTNSRAKAFYEREGFEVVKIKSNIFLTLQGLGKQIIMQKLINGSLD